MVRRAYRQRSLIEVLLPDADKLWDPMLRRIDALLDDEEKAIRGFRFLTQKPVLALLNVGDMAPALARYRLGGLERTRDHGRRPVGEDGAPHARPRPPAGAPRARCRS